MHRSKSHEILTFQQIHSSGQEIRYKLHKVLWETDTSRFKDAI